MSTMENAHAPVVGIANYRHIRPLPPTVLMDARDIYDVLIDSQHCGYPPHNVELLLDGEATQQAILQALTNLARRSDKGSAVFIYISSHGGRIESGLSAGEYLLPMGADVERDTDGRVKVGKDAKPILAVETAISSIELTEALRAINARKKVVIFDCWHAGGLTKGAEDAVNVEALRIKGGFSEHYYAELAAGRGWAILASSRNTEYSYVLPGAGNSLFTQHLLAGLQGGIASDDGLIRIFTTGHFAK